MRSLAKIESIKKSEQKITRHGKSIMRLKMIIFVAEFAIRRQFHALLFVFELACYLRAEIYAYFRVPDILLKTLTTTPTNEKEQKKNFRRTATTTTKKLA